MPRDLWHLAAGLLLALAAACAQAADEPIRLQPTPRQAFSEDARILVDDSGQLGPAEVSARSGAFRPVRPSDLERHYDSRAFWLRATVHNPGTETAERWLAVGHPRIEAATLFHSGPGGWSAVESGLRVPSSRKPVDAVGVVLPFTLGPGESRQLLLRVQSRTAVDLNASVWQPVALIQSVEGRRGMIAAGFGGSLIVAYVSLTALVRLRQRTYLYFCLLHLSTGLMELGREGLWERYLWPPDWALPVHAHTAMAMMSMLSLIFVQRDFLSLPSASPRWDRSFLALSVAGVLLMPISLVNYTLWNGILSRIVLVTAVLSLIVAFAAWRRGDKAAGYLTTAYGAGWVVEGLRAVSNLGFVDLPFTKYTSLTWALLIASPMFLLALAEHTRRLSGQLREAHESSLARSNFLARVSHELHAPLNTIIGYARMLRRGSSRLPLDEGMRDIEHNGLRLLGMINELLDQSHLESGNLALHPQPVALAQWLDELERAGEVLAEASGNAFVLTRRGVLPAGVRLDSARLRQVLDNLISNANRHTRRGTIEVSCQAAPAPAEDRVRLSFAVADSGEGIQAADLTRIFEPFYQGRSMPGSGERRRAGVGLGLSIARDLVRLMGGDLKATSKPGVGSTFTLDVLCSLTAEPAPPPATAPSAVTRQRILLADDEQSSLNLLSDLLQSLGCEVTCARSAQEAIALLAGGAMRWDLVITDQAMGTGDGWAVLEQVRRQRAHMPVILVSAMPMQPPAHWPAGVQFDAFISKPVERSALAAALNALRRTRQDLKRPDATRMAELARLVRLGEVSGIEDWCSALESDQPDCSGYARQVQQAARRLDFGDLQSLVAEPRASPSG